ncbi:ESX secretion-associated protein EspG [Rhodococcus sp. SGAir0479]|uniref:ESX secretion-associated protein EspG n=1 Tax=Rhodococcus sp. SGAir0479 TaxID=2567884 RepID=UPI0010CD2667|nr:ESX secretion-associated protein EspG [Rhodococcus sp. SGAir0479]QCQ92359.1 ESX secretion-associated protein EspG [Rhodococcus sp. SGAir0479]
MAEYSTRGSVAGDRWRFTGLEFQVLWRHLGLDRLPYPLRYRPAAETQDELDRRRREAATSALARVTDTLYLQLAVLAEPTVRVEVFGFTGAQRTPVRMHAGIGGGRGVLAVQVPGPDTDTGGDVVLHAAGASRIPDAIAAALPAVPPGAMAPLRFRRSDLQAGRGTVLAPAGATGIRHDALALLKRPRTGLGEITAFAGAAYDSRPTDDGVALHWMDYADDGRYTFREATDIAVTPASETQLAADIRQLVALVAARDPAR